jgi:hypothetical protein
VARLLRPLTLGTVRGNPIFGPMRVDVTLCQLFPVRCGIDPLAKSPASSRMLRLMRQSASEYGRLSPMTSGRIIIGWRVGT